MHIVSRRATIALLAFVAAASSTRAMAQGVPTEPWRNESLPFEARARDLVGRLSLEEKVGQMQDVAPAIERLGIPAYNWWNEALHGVARSGLATVFPQAIGMAATWDENLMFRVATVISDEGRAKYHEYLRNDSHARYQGLTFWSPNINLFRDPRWGRGQETYGEDPYLTGRLAVQFIHGLQGNDPTYFKTIATVKHFAVHSGPEPERHSFDARVSERDMRESYLPHFEVGIREGGAYSLMCAYNRIDGKAACASDPMLRDLLRGEWKFNGYIVSDCGAIDDIYLRHRIEPTAAAAAASAVRSGTDLDCGRVYPNLVQAVSQGLITEAEIDTSITRLFLARFKLGMFDAPTKVKWSQIPFSVVDSPRHQALALQAARESIVLLRNAGNVLPLRKSLGTLAVIGPNADEPRMLLGNYNGEPSHPVTPLAGIRAALSSKTRVLYARGADLAQGFPPFDSTARPAGRRGTDTTTTPAAALRSADSLEAEAVRIAQSADAVVLFLGLTARLEGEEMPVQIDGFKGGDRTTIDLPAVQQHLLERVMALGKPTVLVLLNGSALAVNWAQDHVPAIVDAWYPGQAGGTAIADVLFGDYNPAGRLPITFYKSVTDIPPFENYDMVGRTYRFFTGTPLYPFGHGLSYTTFAYGAARANRTTLADGDSVAVSVMVRNSGARRGDEVVQLYARHVGSKLARSLRDLRGFQRITLAPGQQRLVRFIVPSAALTYWNSSTHGWSLESDTVQFELGASAADIRARTSVRVLPAR
jgi:beta-glucosidase